MSTPVLLPFAADRATLDAVLESDAMPELAARRAIAFDRFDRSGRGLKLPYRRPVWVSGERIMRTSPLERKAGHGVTNDGRPNDELATLALANAGGLVHFGSLAIRNTGPTSLPAGVSITPIAAALRDRHDELEPFLARRIDRAKTSDAHLTASFLNCGALISVADGVRIAEPLQLLWIYAPGQTHTVFPFIAISVGMNAEVTIIERHHGEADAFVCGMVDAQIAENGALHYVVVQQLGDAAQMRMARTSRCAKRSRAAWHIADLGAVKIRNTTTTQLRGVHAKAHISTLAFRSAKQRIDSTMRGDMHAASTRMSSVTSVALIGQSVARQHERIAVRAGAAGANASSSCEGLLLSRGAAVEFQPDRVAAQNGISVGQRARIGSIDAEALFYLATRGIDHQSAMKIIALGFYEPAITAFPNETIRDEIRTALDERIEEAVT